MNHCFWHDPKDPYLVLFDPGSRKAPDPEYRQTQRVSLHYFQKTKKRKDDSSSSSSEEEDEEDMELLRSEPLS
jgi:hypothetical protein